MAETGLEKLWNEALYLRRHALKRKGEFVLPPLWFLTDPARMADPAALAARLPRGAGVIYRGFGRSESLMEAQQLARVARAEGLVLLIGLDARLAARVGAHGVHLPERLAHLAPRLRRRRPGWIITVAAHNPTALGRAARFGADAALLSAVFPSRSPSAGRPLGVVRFAAMTRKARLPVVALGGIKPGNIRRLCHSGAAGVAAIDGLRT